MLESIAEEDDELLLLYLEGETIPDDIIIKTVRKATLDKVITPVLCGSAFKNKSIQPLLDAIVHYLPSPADCPLIKGHSTTDEEIHRRPDMNDPFSGLIFKVMSDPYVGKLAYLRIYSGSIKTGKSILNVSKNKKIRPNKLLQMHANNRKEIEAAKAGDIVAAIGLKFAGTGDTLSDISHPILLESIDFPEPVISRAIEPKKPGDHDKIQNALQQLSDEDPTLITYIDSETGQTIISGMGELHLEIILDRLVKEFSLAVNSGKPQVNYKESITKPVTVDYELSHIAGAQADYAYVKINIVPKKRGSGHRIQTSADLKKIPKEFIEASREGIRQSLKAGVIGGYEVVDLDIDICDLKYIDEQSTEIAFMTASSYVLMDALKKGESQLLEPYFTVSIHTPEKYVGDVMDDIKKRKGNITDMEILPKSHKVIATAPLSQLFGYSTAIRSITRGNGHYAMIFSHYDFVE